MKRPLIVVGGLALLAAVTLVVSTPNLFSFGAKEEQKATSDNDTKTGKNPIVLIDTSMGKIKVELYPDKAPKTVKNFLSYVHDKFYDGTIFHRVIPQFMIQGGGMTKDMTEKPTKPAIVNESDNGLKNVRGTIAMARTSKPNSATSQFFINTGKSEKGNPFLDRANAQDNVGYCVFGKVIDGMDVVKKIENVPTTRDVPNEPVIIKSIRVVKD